MFSPCCRCESRGCQGLWPPQAGTFYGFFSTSSLLPFKAALLHTTRLKPQFRGRGLHPQRHFQAELSPGNTDPLLPGCHTSPHLPRLLTSPQGAFSDPATPLTCSAHCSLHCHLISTAPAGLSSPSSLPRSDFLPFSGCQGTLLPPMASLLLFLPGVPAKAPVPSTVSHLRCRREAGVMPPRLSPPSLLCLSQDTLMLSSGDLANEWSVSYLISIRSFLSTMQSFPYPSFSPVICNIHASYLLSVPDLYQASESYALWLLKFLMLLGIFVHSQEN